MGFITILEQRYQIRDVWKTTDGDHRFTLADKNNINWINIMTSLQIIIILL